MKKVLVVDDEPGVRDMLVAVLEEEGYAVVAASTGPRALEMLPQECPDLVLLDIMLPGVDGREVFRRMADLPAVATTPVILMSAAARPNMTDRRAAAFLPKPFDLDDLLVQVERNINGPRLAS